jgi:hypothetical protein
VCITNFEILSLTSELSVVIAIQGGWCIWDDVIIENASNKKRLCETSGIELSINVGHGC